MTTPVRPWPKNAMDARDQAAEAANDSIRILRPLVRGDRLTGEEVLRRQALVLDNLQTITWLLEAVGAQTRPYAT